MLSNSGRRASLDAEEQVLERPEPVRAGHRAHHPERGGGHAPRRLAARRGYLPLAPAHPSLPGAVALSGLRRFISSFAGAGSLQPLGDAKPPHLRLVRSGNAPVETRAGHRRLHTRRQPRHIPLSGCGRCRGAPQSDTAMRRLLRARREAAFLHVRCADLRSDAHRAGGGRGPSWVSPTGPIVGEAVTFVLVSCMLW